MAVWGIEVVTSRHNIPRPRSIPVSKVPHRSSRDLTIVGPKIPKVSRETPPNYFPPQFQRFGSIGGNCSEVEAPYQHFTGMLCNLAGWRLRFKRLL